MKKLRLDFRINVVAKYLLGGINRTAKCPLLGEREEGRWILELFCLIEKHLVCQQLYLEQNEEAALGWLYKNTRTSVLVYPIFISKIV